MAYEASEIMCASALLYSNNQLDKYSKDYEGLVDLAKDIKKKINTTKLIEFGNATIRKGFIDTIDENNEKSIEDLAVGISAARGLRDYSNKQDVSASQKVYMTGNVLPKDVQKFQVSAFGMKDYNSSDLMYTRDKKVFYGISLKKKNKPKAPNPTLINKAFDSILIGPEFNKLKKELVDIRIKYFSDVVIEAVKKNIIRKSDIKNFESLKSSNRKELYEAKQRDKKLFDRAYIDVKGSYQMKGGYLDKETNEMIEETSYKLEILQDVGTMEIEYLCTNIKDIAKQIAAMIIKAAILAAIFALIPGLGGAQAAAGGATNFSGILQGMMGGSFASGGNPPVGKVSLIGEEGPELFVPNSSGTIISNNELGGGTVIPDVRITGDDLLIVFDRANRRKNRR